MYIETKRLILREWSKNDIDFMIDGLNDFNVAKNLIIQFSYTKRCFRFSKQTFDT